MYIVRLHPRCAESEARGRGPATARGFPRRLQPENSYCAPSQRIIGKHGVARLHPDPKAASDLSWDLQLQSPVAPGQWLSLALNVFLSLIRETSGTILLCEEHQKGPHLCRGWGRRWHLYRGFLDFLAGRCMSQAMSELRG